VSCNPCDFVPTNIHVEFSLLLIPHNVQKLIIFMVPCPKYSASILELPSLTDVTLLQPKVIILDILGLILLEF
jgi:hypothetical protein